MNAATANFQEFPTEVYLEVVEALAELEETAAGIDHLENW